MTLFGLLLLGRGGGLRKSVARFPFIFISSPYPPPRAVLRARFSAHFQLTPSLYYLLFCVWSIARNYAKLYVLRLFKGHPQQNKKRKKTLMTAPSPPPSFCPPGDKQRTAVRAPFLAFFKICARLNPSSCIYTSSFFFFAFNHIHTKYNFVPISISIIIIAPRFLRVETKIYYTRMRRGRAGKGVGKFRVPLPVCMRSLSGSIECVRGEREAVDPKTMVLKRISTHKHTQRVRGGGRRVLWRGCLRGPLGQRRARGTQLDGWATHYLFLLIPFAPASIPSFPSVQGREGKQETKKASSCYFAVSKSKRALARSMMMEIQGGWGGRGRGEDAKKKKVFVVLWCAFFCPSFCLLYVYNVEPFSESEFLLRSFYVFLLTVRCAPIYRRHRV